MPPTQPGAPRHPDVPWPRAEVTGVPVLQHLGELDELLDVDLPLYVRFSLGPVADAAEQSVDGESGCVLPGLSVNRLAPEPWWTRPRREWVARQLCQYDHLADGRRRAWVLTGDDVGRGPDSEPLVAHVRPVALLDPPVLEQARELYRAAMRPGQVPSDP